MAEVAFLPQLEELDRWLSRMRQELERRTGRRDIEVTGGPYRSYDVRVSEAPDGHPVVDLYSAMHWDASRVGLALDYATRLIEDWEATRAEHEAEMRVVRPIFERLQARFPDIEMNYTTGHMDTHKVSVGRDRETGRLWAFFDLWPAMKDRDVESLARYIEEYAEGVRRGATMAGCDYWGEA